MNLTPKQEQMKQVAVDIAEKTVENLFEDICNEMDHGNHSELTIEDFEEIENWVRKAVIERLGGTCAFIPEVKLD